MYIYLLRTFCACAQYFAYDTHFAHTYAECGSQVRKMSAAQKQIAYIMYAACVQVFVRDGLEISPGFGMHTFIHKF